MKDALTSMEFRVVAVMAAIIIVIIVGASILLEARPDKYESYLEKCALAMQADYGDRAIGAKMFDELCKTGQWKEGEE